VHKGKDPSQEEWPQRKSTLCHLYPDFQTPELGEISVVEATHSVVFCYSRPNKLIQHIKIMTSLLYFVCLSISGEQFTTVNLIHHTDNGPLVAVTLQDQGACFFYLDTT
jgi:hypothetical protein